ncbi:hypothetical protein PPL_11102 [Heterostelium album PN500]|uniref:Ankyrin repeat protein n=1 Tax=Heterostelium pallidum (strain ATCC 26659 / Pp 5 / PN500) TaxID=670386 RepID=D3BSY2_HETP5|nr:hypothetical protein PPL_11102 [Heterostelium album PN500]EFA75597.1 hypothetical protein PPL_11102 [Heterostelium album PN500]|eukprot:XP_020427731.1 hypothetical protein PPL_11102 [Heterostelium album PN500]
MNTELFLKIFKNKLLKIDIFKQVNQLNRSESYYSCGWEELQKRFTLLIKFNYVDKFRIYLKSYQQRRIKEVNSFSFIYYQSIRTAVRFAKIDIIKVITDEFNLKLNDYVKPRILMRQASLSGSLEMLLFLDQQTSIAWQVSDYIEAFIKSPINSDLEIVKWLYGKIRPAINESTKRSHFTSLYNIYKWTAKKGKIDIFKWLMEQDDLKTDNFELVIQNACTTGNITFLNYLIDNHSNQINFHKITINLDEIAKNLNEISDPLEIIKWVHQHFSHFKCSTDLMDAALQIDSLELIQWLHENRNERFSRSGMTNFYEYSLETLTWIQMKGIEMFSTETMSNAGFDSSKKLKWLHENSTMEFTEDTVENAAYSGKFKSIKYLHQISPNLFTKKAMSNAAGSNKMELVKWFHENRTEGCTYEAIDNACENNNLEMVKWLNENRTEGGTFISIMYSIINNNVEMFQYLLENVFNKTINADRDEPFIFDSQKITTRQAMSECFFKLLKKHQTNTDFLGEYIISYIKDLGAMNGCLDLIRDYYELGNFSDLHHSNDTPLFYASLYNHLDIVKYFVEIRKVKWNSSKFCFAHGNGHFDVCECYFENTPTPNLKKIMEEQHLFDKESTNEFLENFRYIFDITFF